MANDDVWVETRLPQQKPTDGGGLFPTVLIPNPTVNLDLRGLIEAVKSGKGRAQVEKLLQSNRAVLLRGGPVSTASDFNDVVEAFGYQEHIYTGGMGSRSRIIGRVYTANESPPEKPITFHHEMVYAPESPDKLFFFCEEEPASGGETPIAQSHIIYERMLDKYPDFVREMEEHGLLYTSFLGDDDNHISPIGRSWQTVYSTNDKSVAEERAAKFGMKMEWVDGGANVLIGPVPGVKFDKTRGCKVWYNGLAVSYSWKDDKSIQTDVIFGNGKPMPDGYDEMLEYCMGILEEECVAIPWKKGDVLLLDNKSVLHSRRPFLPPRRVLAALCK